ncbi:MAG: hypothetical protein K2M69_00265 [Muribaculaceae bacterium]|nr:hypothetical protein [Muribaculaceae bacterium]
MREKKRERVRKWGYPVLWIWGLLASIIGYSGMCLMSFAYLMVGDTRQAKKVFTERV